MDPTFLAVIGQALLTDMAVASSRSNSSVNDAAIDSAWQAPVPYLVGGLVAILGATLLALLFILWSYWCFVPSDFLEGGNQVHARGSAERNEVIGLWNDHDKEERVIVIMAGEERPTFLAKPTSLV